MIQAQNDVTLSINSLETQMNQLVNTMNVRNEETLPTQFLTNPNTSNQSDQTHESWCFGNTIQDSILSQHFELDQFQTLENQIDNLASFYFNKIELEQKCDPILNFVIQFQILNQYRLLYCYLI